ncbi:hypothetical protein MMC16_000579 [Acarospora aff. strigata]|nr:hypothetical protein [Acarospora aff. strigata]
MPTKASAKPSTHSSAAASNMKQSSATNKSLSSSTARLPSSTPRSSTAQITPASSSDVAEPTSSSPRHVALGADLGACLGMVAIALALVFGLRREQRLVEHLRFTKHHDAGSGMGHIPPPYGMRQQLIRPPVQLMTGTDAAHELAGLSTRQTKYE